ncbi:MAG: NAD(P)/FAD-dependent oxidoreductase [Oscillospiraceae bacterium]
MSYCATCDGMLYRGKRAAVIGLAADAPAEADFLREIGCDVQYYDGKKHRFEIRGAERADTLVIDGAAQPADVIFVLRAGFAADTLLPGIATEKGHIVVDESYAASIPGVFAAGDCTGAPYQIPAAVGEGNRAALSVVRWLRNA